MTLRADIRAKLDTKPPAQAGRRGVTGRTGPSRPRPRDPDPAPGRPACRAQPVTVPGTGHGSAEAIESPVRSGSSRWSRPGQGQGGALLGCAARGSAPCRGRVAGGHRRQGVTGRDVLRQRLLAAGSTARVRLDLVEQVDVQRAHAGVWADGGEIVHAATNWRARRRWDQTAAPPRPCRRGSRAVRRCRRGRRARARPRSAADPMRHGSAPPRPRGVCSASRARTDQADHGRLGGGEHPAAGPRNPP